MHNGGNCRQKLRVIMQKRISERMISRKLFLVLLILVLGISGCSAKPDITVDGFLSDIEETERYTQENADLHGSNTETDVTDTEVSVETEELLQVFVCGAVENPGVYRLKEDARVYEAVDAAGGFSPEADRDWLNLAETVQDGGKLRVYTMEETAGLREQGFEEPDMRDGRSDVNGEENGTDRKINLNTASREQLMTLPGIGEAKAEAVIAYREEHGSFQNIEEIKRISGIKDAVFLKIKDRITV